MRCVSPCLWLLVVTGCVGAPPVVDPLGDLTAATGIADAVRFASDAEPIDAATMPSELTLELATRMALLHDPRLQQALAAVRAAEAGADQARRWPNPVLDVMLRFPDAGGQSRIEAGLAGELVAILQTPARARAADQRLRRACAEAVAAALAVVTETAELHASLQALAAELPLLRQRAQAAQQLTAFAERRLLAGEGTRAEVDDLAALHLQVDLELARRQQEQQVERLHLQRLLGAPGAESEWRLGAGPEPPPAALPLPALVEAALAGRPEAAAARCELAARGEQVALADWSPFASSTLGVRTERDHGWISGPQLAVPLPVFDGGAPARAGADAELVAARHRATEVARGIVEEVRRAVTTLAATRASLQRVEAELLPLQQQRRARAEAALRAGHGDAQAVLLAEQDLRAAEVQRIALQRDVTLAGIALQRAVGGAGVLRRVAAGLAVRR